MALDGLPKTGRMGFELFDKTNFGLTDFAERINYRRALEGELERSMGHLAEVEQARVHLTFPKDSVFLEARQPAKASIMLRTRPGAQLSSQNVQAVCHLVSSAVEGLAPESVSVLDTRGNLLNRPRRGATGDPLEASEATLEFRNAIERDLLNKVRATLEPLLGPDRFQAGISVDCDFSSGELSEETFDPSKSVALSSQKTEDGTPALASAGIPGTASNLPRPASTPAAAMAQYARRTENLTYQTSRMVRHTRQPQGAIRRLSVALLLDQDVRWEGTAAAPRRVLVPPSPEKLKSIRELVAGVVNFNAARGDQLVVETLPFEATLRSAPPEAPARPGAPRASPGFAWPPDQRLLTLAGAAAGLLLLLAAAVWLLARRKRRRKPPHTAAALPSGAEGDAPALAEGPAEQAVPAPPTREQIESEVLRALKMPAAHTQKAEILIRELRSQITKDPPGATQVLRMWLRGV
jgi:flagellar M-ring protein FliF